MPFSLPMVANATAGLYGAIKSIGKRHFGMFLHCYKFK